MRRRICVPASSTISSPGCAALSAACRSPPLRTCLISADTGDARRRRTMRTMTGNSIPFGDARYSTDEVGSDGRRTPSSRPTNVEYKSSTSSRCSAGDSAVATPRAPAATTRATASQSACFVRRRNEVNLARPHPIVRGDHRNTQLQCFSDGHRVTVIVSGPQKQVALRRVHGPSARAEHRHKAGHVSRQAPLRSAGAVQPPGCRIQ